MTTARYDLDSLLQLYAFRLLLNSLEAGRGINQTDLVIVASLKSALREKVLRLESYLCLSEDEWLKPDSATQQPAVVKRLKRRAYPSQPESLRTAPESISVGPRRTRSRFRQHHGR